MRLSSLVANVILACAVPPDDRPHVLGDLVEEYGVRREETSRLSATWWYWTQVLRSIPWLLWSPVRRSGWATTLGVALAASAAQAILELTIVQLVPNSLQDGVRGAAPATLAVVLASLVIVSWIASRVRPGAGALLTVIASVVILARTLRSGIEVVHVSHILESVSAPSAALLGAALAVNVRPFRKAD